MARENRQRLDDVRMQPYCMDEAAVRQDVERGLGLHHDRPVDVTANPNVLRPIE